MLHSPFFSFVPTLLSDKPASLSEIEGAHLRVWGSHHFRVRIHFLPSHYLLLFNPTSMFDRLESLVPASSKICGTQLLPERCQPCCILCRINHAILRRKHSPKLVEFKNLTISPWTLLGEQNGRTKLDSNENSSDEKNRTQHYKCSCRQKSI